MDLFSPRHLLVILLIVLVVFGTKKLRTIGADLGGAIKGFKTAMNEGQAAANAAASAPAPVAEAPRQVASGAGVAVDETKTSQRTAG